MNRIIGQSRMSVRLAPVVFTAVLGNVLTYRLPFSSSRPQRAVVVQSFDQAL
jgi:hypothetical protein